MRKNYIQILVSYFRFFGKEVARYFERFESQADKAFLLNIFLEIVEGELYHVETDKKGKMVLEMDYDVPEEIEDIVEKLIVLYHVDKSISESIDKMLK